MPRIEGIKPPAPTATHRLEPRPGKATARTLFQTSANMTPARTSSQRRDDTITPPALNHPRPPGFPHERSPHRTLHLRRRPRHETAIPTRFPLVVLHQTSGLSKHLPAHLPTPRPANGGIRLKSEEWRIPPLYKPTQDTPCEICKDRTGVTKFTHPNDPDRFTWTCNVCRARIGVVDLIGPPGATAWRHLARLYLLGYWESAEAIVRGIQEYISEQVHTGDMSNTRAEELLDLVRIAVETLKQEGTGKKDTPEN